MATRELDDAVLARLRDEGLLVCRCKTPQPELIPLFSAIQCAVCERPIEALMSHPKSKIGTP